jgi:hypothetical protein
MCIQWRTKLPVVVFYSEYISSAASEHQGAVEPLKTTTGRLTRGQFSEPSAIVHLPFIYRHCISEA